MWSSSTSGLKGNAAPIPLNFSIPGGFSASNAGINLQDSFTAQFKLQPPLIIPDGCSADLIGASFAYSQPNVAGVGEIPSIAEGNNRISINWDAAGYIDYTIPTGLYDYLDVQYQLNVIAKQEGWSTGAVDLFTIQGVSSTQKIVLTINPAALVGGIFPAGGVLISFADPSPVSGSNDSMGTLLGFPTSGVGSVISIAPSYAFAVIVDAPNVAGFSDTSAYLLYMSLVTNSYKDGVTGQLLYAFPLGNSTPNSVVSWQSSLRYPVPITPGTFSSVSVWTTDQSGNKLPWSFYQAPFQFSCLISKNKQDGSV